jgi:hypothetical protein
MLSYLWGSAPSPTIFPELDTVKGTQDLVQLAEKAFQAILEAESSPDWEPYEYNDTGFNGLEDITIQERTLPDNNVGSTKVTGTIGCSPQALYNKLSKYDLEWAQQFDTDLVEFTRLLTVGEDVALVLFRSKAPYPVTPREFVLVRGRKEMHGTYYIYSMSVNYEKAAYDANFVRGVVPHNAFILRPVQGNPHQTRMTRITAIDPKGSVPSFVVNMMKTKSGDYLGRLRETAASL